MLCRQGPSERRSRPRLRENGARRGSGGKDSPNGAYRSEGLCRTVYEGQGDDENLLPIKKQFVSLCRGGHRGLNCRPKMRLHDIIVYKQ